MSTQAVEPGLIEKGFTVLFETVCLVWYGIGAICGICAFCATWYGCIMWGGFMGMMLGWIPAFLAGVVALWLGPIALAVAYFYFN